MFDTATPHGECYVPIDLTGGRTAEFALYSSVSYVECPKDRGGYGYSFAKIVPGLTVREKSGIHYGWALLSVSCVTSCHEGLTVDLVGYAYETIAGKSIAAGQMTEANAGTRSFARRF